MACIIKLLNGDSFLVTDQAGEDIRATNSPFFSTTADPDGNPRNVWIRVSAVASVEVAPKNYTMSGFVGEQH